MLLLYLHVSKKKLNTGNVILLVQTILDRHADLMYLPNDGAAAEYMYRKYLAYSSTDHFVSIQDVKAFYSGKDVRVQEMSKAVAAAEPV